MTFKQFSLNPCSNGICSKRSPLSSIMKRVGCLNPCSNGICSKSQRQDYELRDYRCLNPCSNGICSKSQLRHLSLLLLSVLILVLMEYALRALTRLSSRSTRKSLNPCSNGICSKSVDRIEVKQNPHSS